MIIESLELKNFRNYDELHIEFGPGTNLLYGDNAQGKTNILEAIYVCATAKSHRGSKDREVIEFGSDEAHIKINFKKDSLKYRIDMHLKKDRPKGIAVNSVPIKKASEMYGIFNAVMFSPEDLNIIKNGPSDRRRFIDIECCQLNKVYVYNLVYYNKSLMQRNRALREMAYRDDIKDTLDVWDMQLIKFGCELIKLRREYIKELNEIINPIHSELSGNKENLFLVYDKNTSEETFEKSIKYNRETDIRQKMTTSGPHRDDIGFIVNNIDIRKYGSQGQQRTAALSLKLSEIMMFERKMKEKPVLLLDDVLSELDSERQKQLLKCISGIQTIITSTGKDDYNNLDFAIDRSFFVKEGTAYRR